ncbi:ABC transporter permease [Bacillota bacterium Meth-B3]|nr:ABC transporter permease subunit [Christensenellaceae bacterium]
MKKSIIGHKLVLIVLTFVLLLPIAATLMYSLTVSWLELIPSGFPNLDYWRELLFETPEFWESMNRSLIISGIPIFISGVVVIMALYVAILHCPKLDSVIQGISMIPYTLRGVVLAISVLSLYAGKGTIFSNRMVMLVCVYCVVILPFIYRGIRNNLYAINVRQLLEAAELLGANGLYTFFRIIVPNMLSGILVSALMALGSVFTDYAVIKIIAGTRYTTVQHVLYNSQKGWPGPKTSALVIIMFSFMLVISLVSYAVQGRSTIQRDRRSKGKK